MAPATAALVVLMDGYIRVLLDPYITLLEVHRLMYFLQVAGEPLGLRFVKGHYARVPKTLGISSMPWKPTALPATWTEATSPTSR